MTPISVLLTLLIYLAILALVYYLVDWLMGQFSLPSQIRLVIRIIMVLLLLVLLLNAIGVMNVPVIPHLTR